MGKNYFGFRIFVRHRYLTLGYFNRKLPILLYTTISTIIDFHNYNIIMQKV